MVLSRLFVALLAISSLLLVGCDESVANDPRVDPPLIRQAVVKAATLSSRSFTGVIAAKVQSDLGFRVAGKVSDRLVDAGQSVRRGQVLMRLDATDLALAAIAQENAVTAAQARAQQALNDEIRFRELRGTGAISASAYDQAKAAADAAKAQLNSIKAQYDVARNAKNYAELIADADGIVTEILAEPGQVVSSGQTVVRLARNGNREALVHLPETYHPSIGSIAQASLFGKTNERTSATLRQVSGSADQNTRTFEARYVLEGDTAKAPLGSTVVIDVADANFQEVGSLQVPIGALFDAGNGPGVWLINGEPAKVHWRPVSIQHLDDASATILGDLKQGDKIVALGAHLLHEAQEVRLFSQRSTSATRGVSND